jgi:HNH endonuclease
LMKVFKRTMPRSRRPEIDHIDAIVLGGVALGFGNHQLLCALCHKAKTKKDIQEKFAKNGNPRKGVKFTESHVQALSESRKGFDSENRKKSREKNLYPTIRVPIVAFKLDTKEEREFCSSAEAAYALGLQESNISRVLRGSQNRKQHKGWTFRFK